MGNTKNMIITLQNRLKVLLMRELKNIFLYQINIMYKLENKGKSEKLHWSQSGMEMDQIRQNIKDQTVLIGEPLVMRKKYLIYFVLLEIAWPTKSEKVGS